MGFAEQLVENRFQGVMLSDTNVQSFAPTEMILSLVKAVHIAETKVDLDKDFHERSFFVSCYPISFVIFHCLTLVFVNHILINNAGK